MAIPKQPEQRKLTQELQKLQQQPQEAPKGHFLAPWNEWSDETKAKADELISVLDDIKNYRATGALARNPLSKQWSAELQSIGGLAPMEALQLGRYRLSKGMMGQGEDWQGPINVNTGTMAPEHIDTKEDVIDRSIKYNDATPEQKQKMWSEEERNRDRSSEHFYGSLAGGTYPPLPPKEEPTTPPPAIAEVNAGPVATLAGMPPGISKKFQPSTDDEKLSDAQLRMMYTLALGQPGAGTSGPNIMEQTMGDSTTNPQKAAMEDEIRKSLQLYQQQFSSYGQ